MSCAVIETIGAGGPRGFSWISAVRGGGGSWDRRKAVELRLQTHGRASDPS